MSATVIGLTAIATAITTAITTASTTVAIIAIITIIRTATIIAVTTIPTAGITDSSWRAKRVSTRAEFDKGYLALGMPPRRREIPPSDALCQLAV